MNELDRIHELVGKIVRSSASIKGLEDIALEADAFEEQGRAILEELVDGGGELSEQTQPSVQTFEFGQSLFKGLRFVAILVATYLVSREMRSEKLPAKWRKQLVKAGLSEGQAAGIVDAFQNDLAALVDH